MSRTAIALVIVLSGGCSLLVPNPDDYTYGRDAEASDDGGPDADAGDPLDAGPTDDDGGPADGGGDGGNCFPETCDGEDNDCDGETDEGSASDLGCGVACSAGSCVGIARIDSGGLHTCAQTAGGDAWCWGSNGDGQVGNAAAGGIVPSPVPVPGLGSILDISAGGNHTCAVRVGGDVLCWGDNEFGQIGDGTVIDRPAPMLVTLPGPAIQVNASTRHTCALLTTGTVHCWGWGTSGTLGDGQSMSSATPVQVDSLTNATSLSRGQGEHQCVGVDTISVKTGWCWGLNFNGQVGGGGTTNAPSPVNIFFIDGYPPSIATGESHTCAMYPPTGDQLWCWGANDDAQLGTGNMMQQNTPVRIMPPAAIEAVATSANASCAVVSGAVWCWGSQEFGQQGDGMARSGHVVVPTVVSGIAATVASISGGLRHFCAVRDDGTVACWGDNSSGQLGTGAVAPIGSPLPPTDVAWD